VTVAHDSKERVYQFIQSHKEGVSIKQISEHLDGHILAPYYVAELIILLRIRSISTEFTSSVLYVAVEPNIKAPV